MCTYVVYALKMLLLCSSNAVARVMRRPHSLQNQESFTPSQGTTAQAASLGTVHAGVTAIPDASSSKDISANQANWAPLADSGSSISYYYYNVTSNTFFHYSAENKSAANTNSNIVQGSYNYYNYQNNTINYYNTNSSTSLINFNSITNNVIGSYDGNNNTGIHVLHLNAST